MGFRVWGLGLIWGYWKNGNYYNGLYKGLGLRAYLEPPM